MEDVPLGDTADLPLPVLRSARDRLIEVRDFDAALSPAVAAVAAQEQQRDPGYAGDLAALARVQAELRDIDAAEARYLEAIDLIESAEGEDSPTLIAVYRGLGRAYIGGARYPEAITTLEHAREITRRTLGLFNIEQSALLDDISTAYLGLGDTVEARELQVERLDNAIRRFGANDLRVVPFRYTLANYYERSRLPDSAREQYEEALASQEAALGSNDPTLLAPLRQLVKLDLLVAQGAETANYDRLKALLEQSAGADSIERGLSLVSLGDWATVTGDPLTARSYYQQAWNTLSTDPELDVAGYFAKPVILDFVAPLSPVDRAARRRPYAWAEVVVDLDVSAEGLPANVRLVGSGTPAGELPSRYSRRLREAHFRPRLTAGEPVATTNVRTTHYFRYYVDEEIEEE